jgi:uncharacterized protein YdhG (YjbR/CyaY superfamily)
MNPLRTITYLKSKKTNENIIFDRKTIRPMNIKHESVQQYIDTFPSETKVILEKIREIILKNAPEATEMIAYNMPAYKMKGKPLVYFAGYEKHIGLYATPSGHEAFSGELSKYKQGKGSVQFPLHQEMPYELIKKMVLFRVTEMTKK